MLEDERQDFQDVYLLVQEYLEEIGYEDLETTEPDDVGIYYIDLIENSNSSNLRVKAMPGEKRFIVTFSYRLSADLANQLSEEEARDLVEAESISEEETKERRAAKNIIDSLSKEDNEEILFRLTEAGSNVFHETVTTEKGNIDGFRLFDQIFPYEDDFSHSDVNDTLRRVVSQGKLSMRFLQYAFGIEIGESENEDADGQTLLDLRIP